MVLDSGGQTDGEEVTRGLKAGRLQLCEEEEEEEDVCPHNIHTYLRMYIHIWSYT